MKRVSKEELRFDVIPSENIVRQPNERQKKI